MLVAEVSVVGGVTEGVPEGGVSDGLEEEEEPFGPREDGVVVKSRALKRVQPNQRWNLDLIDRIWGSPWAPLTISHQQCHKHFKSQKEAKICYLESSKTRV